VPARRHLPFSLEPRTAAAAGFLLTNLTGCGGGQHPDAVADAGAVPPIVASSTAPHPTDAGPRIATTAADTTIARPEECKGSAFDIDRLFDAYGLRAEAAPDGGKTFGYGPCAVDDAEAVVHLARLADDEAIELRVAMDPPKVRPGAAVKLTVTVTNATPEPRSLPFARCQGERTLHAEAFRDGARADLAPSDVGCAADPACQVQRIAVTLAAGGTATMRGEYRARLWKLFEPCDEKPVGPLPAGEYTLRVRTLLQGIEPSSRRSAVPKTVDATLLVAR
jgi:hypothetical protein